MKNPHELDLLTALEDEMIENMPFSDAQNTLTHSLGCFCEYCCVYYDDPLPSNQSTAAKEQLKYECGIFDTPIPEPPEESTLFTEFQISPLEVVLLELELERERFAASDQP